MDVILDKPRKASGVDKKGQGFISLLQLMEAYEILVGKGLDIYLMIPRPQQRGQVAGKRFRIAAGENQVRVRFRPPVTDTLFKGFDLLDFIDKDVIPFARCVSLLYVLIQVLVGDDIVPILLFLVDVDDVVAFRRREQVPQGH